MYKPKHNHKNKSESLCVHLIFTGWNIFNMVTQVLYIFNIHAYIKHEKHDRFNMSKKLDLLGSNQSRHEELVGQKKKEMKFEM